MVLHAQFLYVSSIACPDLCVADKKKVDHVVWMQHGHVELHRRHVLTENMPVDGSDGSLSWNLVSLLRFSRTGVPL